MLVNAVALNDLSEFQPVTLALPECPEGGAILRVEMTGICGSDVKMWHGDIRTPRPLILGHEVLGHIHEISPQFAQRSGIGVGDRVVVNVNIPCWSCSQCWSGQPQTCKNLSYYGSRRTLGEGSGLWGGFAEFMEIAPGSMLHPVSAEVPSHAAVLLGMVANGFDWVIRRGKVAALDRVVVQGAGPQGISCAIAAREAGARDIVMTGLARDEGRLQLAYELADVIPVLVDGKGDLGSQVRDAFGGELADVVVDVTGSPAAFVNSVRAVRLGGRLVLAGLGGDSKSASVVLDDVVKKNLTLEAAMSKSPESWFKATALLESGKYAFERIVSDSWPVGDISTALRALERTDGTAPIKAVVIPFI